MTLLIRLFGLFWFVTVFSLFFGEKERAVKKSSFVINVSSNFEAISDGKKVIVNWIGGNDKSYDYYTIEKSKDGVHFYSALLVKSFGRLTNTCEYSDIDYSPFSGISYYRLRQNDYYGESTYSPIVAVNCQVLNDGSVKPLNDVSVLGQELKQLEGKASLVVLRDVKGNEYICKIYIVSEGSTIYARDTNKELTAGQYIVVASSCNPLYQQKVVVR